MEGIGFLIFVISTVAFLSTVFSVIRVAITVATPILGAVAFLYAIWDGALSLL